MKHLFNRAHTYIQIYKHKFMSMFMFTSASHVNFHTNKNQKLN